MKLQGGDMELLIPLMGNSQKLDGGAMFGHVPKAVGSKWLKPDDNNRVKLACRALLIKEKHRHILLEAGIGAFFEPELRSRYGVEEPHHVLLQSLANVGLTDKDIDVIVLSHMHFDHAGGLLSEWSATKPQTLLFPKAKYLVSKAGWERALNPHVRDKASFVPHLNEMLKASGRLTIVDSHISDILGPDYHFMFSDGHTPGLMHTIINEAGESPVIFASDLIPGTPWVHLPVTMGYDRSPELLIEEKKKMLELAIKQNGKLFYTHDSSVAMSRV